MPLVSFKLADSHWKKNSELPLIPTQCSGYICLKMLWADIHMTCYNKSGPVPYWSLGSVHKELRAE